MRNPTKLGRGVSALTTIACALLAGNPATAAGGQSRQEHGHGHRAHSARHAHAAGRHGRGHRARSGHTLNGSETAHLHLVHQQETHLFEEGTVTGTLRGRMRANLVVGTLFTGGFTIQTRHGSIRGHGSARPHGIGRYQSFGGTLTITGGSGRYRHIHGRARLYGTFDRRTFAVVVKTHGRLHY